MCSVQYVDLSAGGVFYYRNGHVLLLHVSAVQMRCMLVVLLCKCSKNVAVNRAGKRIRIPFVRPVSIELIRSTKNTNYYVGSRTHTLMGISTGAVLDDIRDIKRARVVTAPPRPRRVLADVRTGGRARLWIRYFLYTHAARAPSEQYITRLAPVR